MGDVCFLALLCGGVLVGGGARRGLGRFLSGIGVATLAIQSSGYRDGWPAEMSRFRAPLVHHLYWHPEPRGRVKDDAL